MTLGFLDAFFCPTISVPKL